MSSFYTYENKWDTEKNRVLEIPIEFYPSEYIDMDIVQCKTRIAKKTKITPVGISIPKPKFPTEESVLSYLKLYIYDGTTKIFSHPVGQVTKLTETSQNENQPYQLKFNIEIPKFISINVSTYGTGLSLSHALDQGWIKRGVLLGIVESSKKIESSKQKHLKDFDYEIESIIWRMLVIDDNPDPSTLLNPHVKI